MRAHSFNCPNCRSELPAGQVDTLTYGRTANSCPHCNAQFSAALGSALLQFVIAITLAIIGVVLLAHFAPPGLMEHDSAGRIERHDLRNKLVLLPVIFAAFFIARRVVARRVVLKVIPPRHVFTADQLARMKAAGVTYNGEYFSVGEMGYDRLEDAIAAASQRAPDLHK